MDQPGRRQIQRGPDNPCKHKRGQEPSKPIPKTIVVGLVRQRETDEMEEGNEESSHDTSEDGWETACEKAKDVVVMKQEEEANGRAEKDKVRNWHDREPIRSVFCFGWDAIRAWIVQPKPDHGVSRGKEEQGSDRRRTGPDENRDDKYRTTKPDKGRADLIEGRRS